MTLLAYNSNIVQNSTVALMGTGDHVVVGAQGYIANWGPGATILSSTGVGFYITVAGVVAAYETAISLGYSDGVLINSTCSNVKISITSSGVLEGDHALNFVGDDFSLTNRGMISDRSGMVITALGPNMATIDNFGSISGFENAIFLTRLSEIGLRVVNFGEIAVPTGKTAFLADSASITNDSFINKGTVIGNILLGGGNDYYDGRGGTVYGTINGGLGDDTFRPGMEEETIDGGLGIDILSFRFGGAVSVALDGSFENTGSAAGDSYVGIENVTGSASGADLIVGTSGANRLFGLDGADSLVGLAGGDVLVGGLGVDVLNGGTGNDLFLFQRLSECGDRILDFTNISGNDDRVQIAAGFGGGLVAGALAATQFQNRADTVAQDADDRFIFRSTDTTLWFDADGNGAGAAIMVADLQAGATMTASDILIF